LDWRLTLVGGCGSLLTIAALLAATPASSQALSCPNESLRGGASSRLPDCRAYELVTPSDTGGFFPMERTLSSPFQYFSLSAISPSGESVVFQTEGGVMPGFTGSGSDDRYRSVRTASGWSTSLDGPSAAQSETPGPGGVSVDQGYSFVVTRASGLPDRGSLNQAAGVSTEESSTWVRHPDGSFSLVGQGELANDPHACGEFIAPGGSHIVFDTRDCSGTGPAGPQLRLDAPASGVQAIYDRTPNGLHTVSLLPGDAIPIGDSKFKGVSADGSAVLFSNAPGGGNPTIIGPGVNLYVRVDDAETLEVASGNAGTVVPAGVSADGGKVFYVQAGNLRSFDTGSHATVTIASSGDAEAVNISADGSRAYFVSHHQVGGEGLEGEPNLFVWNAATGTTTLVATVAPADVSGEPPCLNCWTNGPAAPRMDFITGPGTDTSRATPDGSVLVFESRAKLTGFENEGHTEIYRYDAAAKALGCVSCGPPGPPAFDARLQVFNPFLPVGPPYSYLNIANLTADGAAVFFETAEPLVARDVDGVVDVYEWKEGAVALVTSGQSPSDNFLYGVTPSGRDVIFATNDTLLPRDHAGGSGSIYDARVDGGFAEEASSACLGDACQGQPSPPPPTPESSSISFHGKGNLHPRRRHCSRPHPHRTRHAAHGAKRQRAKRCRHSRRGAGR